MAGVLLRGGKATQRHGRDSHMKMETKIGEMQPPANKCLEPPEARRNREASSLKPVEGAQPC